VERTDLATAAGPIATFRATVTGAGDPWALGSSGIHPDTVATTARATTRAARRAWFLWSAGMDLDLPVFAGMGGVAMEAFFLPDRPAPGKHGYRHLGGIR